MEQAYFLTVDWCNKGFRGIFCSKTGGCFRKVTLHTEQEIQDILGPFTLILKPESRLYSEDQLTEFTCFVPLAEYSNEFGIAVKPRSAEQQPAEPDVMKAAQE